jgi:hypothetical protein
MNEYRFTLKIDDNTYQAKSLYANDLTDAIATIQEHFDINQVASITHKDAFSHFRFIDDPLATIEALKFAQQLLEGITQDDQTLDIVKANKTLSDFIADSPDPEELLN